MAKRRRNRKTENKNSQKSSSEIQQMIRDKAESLFDAAAELVIRTQKGSIRLLQHELDIDYQVAAELINLLENEGIIGPYSSSGAREVLIGNSSSETETNGEDEGTNTDVAQDEKNEESGANGKDVAEKPVEEKSELKSKRKTKSKKSAGGKKEESPADEDIGKGEDEVSSENPDDAIESKNGTEQSLKKDDDGTSRPKDSHSSAKVFIIATLLLIGLVAIINWNNNQKTIVHFKLQIYLSDLVKGDDGICGIYINGKRASTSNTLGESEFDYTAKIGDTLKLTYKKINYLSKSDTWLIVKKDAGDINQFIHFKSKLPKVKEEAISQNFNVNLSFYNDSKFTNTILLNGDSLTLMKPNEKYNWGKTFKASENAHLNFSVNNKVIPLITNPASLVYNVNRDIKTNVIINAILDRPVYSKILVLEEKSKEPVSHIVLDYSDSKGDTVGTDESGLIRHKLYENRLGRSVTFSFLQAFIKLHSGESKYTLAVLDTTLPDTLVDTVYCDLTYMVELVVKDQNEEPISQAQIDIEGMKYTSDKYGHLKFTVPNKSKSYSVHIEKDRFVPLNTSIQPTGIISEFPIEMMGTFGSIILIDSLQNEVTAPFVDIIEDNKVLAQTNSEGKCTISILLGESLDLSLKPLESSLYQSKKVHLTFERPNETKYIKIWPKPFTFNFHVTDDKGKKLEKVKINYNGLSYNTDKNGNASIERYATQLNPNEEFEIIYRYYKEKRMIPIINNKRDYSVNHVIGTKVEVEVRTNPEKGNVKVLDMAENIIVNQKAPLTTSLDLGSYRFIAEDESGNSDEEVIDINGKPEEPIVLDMVNNIAIILTAYSNKNYQKVIQVYSRDKSKIMNDLNHQEKYRGNKCEILRYIAKAHGFENQYKEAQEIWRVLIQDCEEKNPFFYNECASVYEHNKNWSEAADMYRKARLYIEYLPIDKRPEFNASTLYNRADCMLNNYQSYQQGTSQLNNPCDYLSEINEVLNDCEKSVNEGNLVNFPIANVNYIKTRVIEEERNCE